MKFSINYNPKIFKAKIIFILFLGLFATSLLNSCGLYRPVDARKNPTMAEEKRRQNIEEGRGIGLKNIIGGRSTTFEFSTSNPLWRASLEILEFIPLNTIDYAGGVIITDWYSEKNNLNESIKISLRFLTNEIRSDSLKIIVYQKKCSPQKDCYSEVLNSQINYELTSAIIKKASELDKENKKK